MLTAPLASSRTATDQVVRALRTCLRLVTGSGWGLELLGASESVWMRKSFSLLLERMGKSSKTRLGKLASLKQVCSLQGYCFRTACLHLRRAVELEMEKKGQMEMYRGGISGRKLQAKAKPSNMVTYCKSVIVHNRLLMSFLLSRSREVDAHSIFMFFFFIFLTLLILNILDPRTLFHCCSCTLLLYNAAISPLWDK